jgi:RNA polymerase sigma-70 factor (ECF subfamily)
VDHYRAFRPTADIEDVWDALRANVDIPRDADAKARLAEVEAAVRALPAAQREVVLLRVWDGLSHAEIAAVLGKNESAVKTAYSRGLASVRAALGPAALLLILLSKQV